MRTTANRGSRVPALPGLESGERYLLESESGRPVEPLQSLVVDHVLLHEGPAVWIDAGGYAVTASLRELAPSDRVLERIRVARGFTPYQHRSLLRTLEEWLRDLSPSLVVLPGFDRLYRSDDCRGESGSELLLAGLADVTRASRRTDAPVLLTRRRDDDFAAPVAEFSTRTLRCLDTPHGPRFVGDDVETTVYHLADGWVQTTFAFWRSVLAAREPLYERAPGPTAGVADGAD